MSREIYVVITQTGTILSRMLKGITGAEYNHASISLTPTLERMYSFGRRHPYNPFWGGFVVESPHWGTFKRFHNTQAMVLAVKIEEQEYQRLCRHIEEMCCNRRKYHYNYLGLYLAALHITRQKENHYYCSEFVRDVLQEHRVTGAGEMAAIVQPVHFLDLPHTPVYCGRLCDYSASVAAS